MNQLTLINHHHSKYILLSRFYHFNVQRKISYSFIVNDIKEVLSFLNNHINAMK